MKVRDEFSGRIKARIFSRSLIKVTPSNTVQPRQPLNRNVSAATFEDDIVALSSNTDLGLNSDNFQQNLNKICVRSRNNR